MEMPHGAATTPTKCGIVGGVEGTIQAGGCERHFWTELPFTGAATTPTKGGIVGGVEGTIQAGGCERHFWTGLLFTGAATTPTKGGIVGGVEGVCEMDDGYSWFATLIHEARPVMRARLDGACVGD